MFIGTGRPKEFVALKEFTFGGRVIPAGSSCRPFETNNFGWTDQETGERHVANEWENIMFEWALVAVTIVSGQPQPPRIQYVPTGGLCRELGLSIIRQSLKLSKHAQVSAECIPLSERTSEKFFAVEVGDR